MLSFEITAQRELYHGETISARRSRLPEIERWRGDRPGVESPREPGDSVPSGRPSAGTRRYRRPSTEMQL